MKRSKRDYTVAVVVRSFQILQALARAGREMGVLEISKAVGIHVSTVYRLLNTFMSRGFVDQNEDTEKYKLGIKLFELGAARLRQMEFRSVALPYLQALHDAFEETVFLGALCGNEVLIVESLSQSRGIVYGSQVGLSEPLYCTGIGKALFAHLRPEIREKITKEIKLQRFTPNTLIQKSELRKELKLIRKRGYSTDNEEIVPGVKCVGAPILAADGYAVAAFSVAGPADRIEIRLKEVAAQVKHVSEQVSRKLLQLQTSASLPPAS